MEQMEQQHVALSNLGGHLVQKLEAPTRLKFNAWTAFVAEDADLTTLDKMPHMPIEMSVVSMKVADGDIFDYLPSDEVPTSPGVPMRIVVSEPYFVEFENAVLPSEGSTPKYTDPARIPSLIKAIITEHQGAVGYLYVAECYVWKGDKDKYVPYAENPDAGPRQEALVVSFTALTDTSTVMGVMPIKQHPDGTRSLEEMEISLQPFQTTNEGEPHAQ